MSVAKVIEISSKSNKSFQDAIEDGIRKAHKTIKHIRGAWVNEQKVNVKDGEVTEYIVNLRVTFVLD